jgi:hypothetical protein
MQRVALLYRSMKLMPLCASLVLLASPVLAQVQVDLKLTRLQYIAHEPIIARLVITNLAGRDIDLHDENGQNWFGFEVTGSEGQPIGPVSRSTREAPLKIETGRQVTRKIDISPLYPVYDFGLYRLRAHVYFADLNKYFYSQTKVFEVTDARPIWEKTVGVPAAAGGTLRDVRTYSLLTNRFPDHTSLYVRVENKDQGVVYATYPLGRIISFDQPHEELDQANQLHVLYCAAPRTWAYARVGLDGQLLSRATFMETKSRPRLIRTAEGSVKVAGGMIDTPLTQKSRDSAPKLSARPPNKPKDE